MVLKFISSGVLPIWKINFETGSMKKLTTAIPGYSPESR
jgi:hypothetical protein